MAEKVNPVKLKQDAERLEKAGRLDQAIALFRQIVEQNPRDWNTINKIGDLYAKLNRTREAAEEYAKVADFYAKDGFLVRAIAMWKKVNRLDTAILDPYLKLADLYGKQGLMMEAKTQYQIVVDEYLKRGKTKDAAEILKKMADLDPGDLKVRSKLADIYTREGSVPKAVEEHIAIALELSKKGHLSEALQVLEKGLKIDPRSTRLREELARVHMVQKNYGRAAQYLEEAVQEAPNDVALLGRLGEAYIEARKIEEAEALFKRLLELNPADEDSPIQMGRVYLLQQRFDLAYAEFIPAVERLLQHKEGEKAAALLQQVVQHNPSHVKSLVKLAEVYHILQMEGAVSQIYSQLTEAYINEGSWEQAASVLETLVSREPQNHQHRSKLDFVRSRAGGRRSTTPAPSLDTVEEMDFELEPPEPLEPVLGSRVPMENLTPSYLPPPAPPAPAAPSSAAGPLAAKRPVIEVSGPLSGEDKEFIDEHLAEGRVFRKYGLVDKSVDQFEAIVARFPDHLEARLDLREVYKEKGLPAQAVEQCLALAEICRLQGDDEAAAAHEAAARELMPAPAPPRQPPTPLPRQPATPPPPVLEEEITLEGQEEGFSLAVEEEEISLDMGETQVAQEAEAAAPIPARFPARPAPDAAPALGGEIFEGEELEEELAPQFVEEAPVESELLVEAEIEEALAPALPDSVEAAAGVALDLGLEEELSLEGAFEIRMPEVAPAVEPPAAPVRQPPRPAPAVAARPSVPAEIARALEEVEQYVSLGFVDDARDALRELVGRQGSHPAIEAKARELGLELEEATSPAPAFEALVEETSFEAPPVPDAEVVALDLGLDFSEAMSSMESPEAESSVEALFAPEPTVAEEAESEPAVDQDFESALELSELFETQSAVAEPEAGSLATEFGDSGLAEIFKEFKKGVDKQLGKEDYDTRYNLGIAYKEMGLLDEAIAEFQLAAKDDARLLECSSMLGICFIEKGMPKLAVKWFEKGLKAPGRTEDEYQGLRYDLAAAHESAGEVEEALGLYTDLYGQNANFRDVAAKVRQLRGSA